MRRSVPGSAGRAIPVAPRRCPCGLIRHMARLSAGGSAMRDAAPDVQPPESQRPGSWTSTAGVAQWPDDLETYHAEVAAAPTIWRTLNLDFVAADRHGSSVSLRCGVPAHRSRICPAQRVADLLRASVEVSPAGGMEAGSGGVRQITGRRLVDRRVNRARAIGGSPRRLKLEESRSPSVLRGMCPVKADVPDPTSTGLRPEPSSAVRDRDPPALAVSAECGQ